MITPASKFLLPFLGLLLSAPTLFSAPSSPSTANGITEPFLDVRLSTFVPGIVSVKKFKEGDAVREGDVILELDKQLEQLEVVRRKAIMDNRKADFDATSVLFKSSKSVSKEEMEKKELEYKVAQAEHEIAIEQLRRRQLISPLSGLITEFRIEVGEACRPYESGVYQTVVRVVDVRRCYFISHLEANQAVGLKLEQNVKMEIDTGAAPASVSGKIVYLAPVADPASGLIRIKVLFENPEGKVRPGLAGKIFLN